MRKFVKSISTVYLFILISGMYFFIKINNLHGLFILYFIIFNLIFFQKLRMEIYQIKYLAEMLLKFPNIHIKFQFNFEMNIFAVA